ncbi:MAG TPA: hemolysin III family protein [Candidatus Saccharimonadales bacterium]|nr:hemolysin III family protein [Candidatus Saccharimonadales bacterium]
MNKTNTNNNPAVKIVEEIFNSITHGLGAIAAVIGLVLGIVIMTWPTSFKVGFIIYASSLIILMLASTLYHSLTFTRAKKVFRAIDHSSIFILIAGSFTPFIIYLYKGWDEILFLVAVWLIAAGGIAVTTTLVLPKKMKLTGIMLYIGFGWMGLFLIPKMSLVNSSVIWLLIAGGILYTVGTIPFAFKKPFAHFSWHLFVIAAACAQFFAIIKLA